MKVQDILVSIILPVFNGKEYIDRCLDSLVRQTYKNIEIIILNDGSTDESAKKCIYWMSKDTRITYYEHENMGLSKTRNRGVELAKGRYWVSVDQDDWLDVCYIEKLLEAVLKYDADIGICDYYKFDEFGKLHYVSCNMSGERRYTKEEYLLLSNSAVWNKMIKKEFWKKNSLEFVGGILEDTSTFPMYILLSNSIAPVSEPLYFYEKYHKGSITNDIEKRRKFPAAFQESIDFFKNRNLFETYKKILYLYFLKWTSNSLAPCLGKVEDEEYKKLRACYISFLQINFEGILLKKTLIWGGYNLSKILRNTSLFADPYHRVQFSSIVSLLNESSESVELHSANPYREMMLQRELKQEYLEFIRTEKPEYVVLDFLEERFDMMLIGENLYAYSDAVMECKDKPEFQRVERNSAEMEGLWEKACDIFIAELKEIVVPENVILVKNYLTKYYGQDTSLKMYEEVEFIEKINGCLKKYYEYFEKNFEGVKVIDFSEDELYFTDEKYEYGKYPWHLNDLINYKMAKEIERYFS